MTVSKDHDLLTEMINQYVKKRKELKGKIFIFNDNSKEIGGASTPKFFNSKPDIYAVGDLIEFVLIGEAKATKVDLENKHTNNQIKDYLRYLKTQKNAEIVLAVKKFNKKIAESILNLETKSKEFSKIKKKVLTI